MRRRDGLAMGGMRFDEMIDRGACGRLPTFVEPEAWHHPRIIGSPDARDEAGCRRRSHDAGRGPHNAAKTPAHTDRLTRFSVSPDRADAPGMGVGHRGAARVSLTPP